MMKFFKKSTWIGLVVLFFTLSAWTLIYKSKPVVYIIGDSTVKTGSGIGDDGLVGWGNMIPAFFDTVRIEFKNYARGGRSSRTFQDEGLWDSIMVRLKPGDYVLMQFGHNDGGDVNTGKARGTLRGNGEETQDFVMEATGKTRTIHTYGWYMRKYISDAKSKGAIPVVLSQVPRNIWKDGKVERADQSYGKWAREAALQGGAFFIDLNEITAKHYEELGPDSVKTFFPNDHTHTAKAGAILNAKSVTEGLLTLKDCDLKNYMLKK
jgi:rhamnogalacturonan acetylesterase